MPLKVQVEKFFLRKKTPYFSWDQIFEIRNWRLNRKIFWDWDKFHRLFLSQFVRFA